MLTFLRENSRWLGSGFLLTVMASFGQTWFISLFAGEIRSVHDISDGTWGGIYTVATLASAALLFWRGSLADTISLGRLAPVICLCFAVSCATLALAPNIFVLGLALFGLRFCGQGMFGHIAMTAMGRWFREYRGRAVSIAGFGHAFGEMIWPLPAILIAGMAGWKLTWLGIAAFLALVFAPMLMALLATDRVPQGSGPGGSSGVGIRGRHWERRDVMRHWLFPALLPILLAPGFIGTVVFFHQVHIAEIKGWTLAQMAPGYVVFASVTTVCALIAGWVADRFGPVNLLPMLLVPMGLGVTIVLPADAVSGWFLALALIGMTQGMAGALWGTFLPQVYGTKHLGAVRALGTTVMVVSSAIGPGITGLLINLGYSFPVQAPGMGLWCLLATGLGFWIRARLKPELISSAQPT